MADKGVFNVNRPICCAKHTSAISILRTYSFTLAQLVTKGSLWLLKEVSEEENIC